MKCRGATGIQLKALTLSNRQEPETYESVRGAMEMAQKLARRHIPIIVSAWFPPPWAIVGEPNFRNENGIFGNPLNQKKMRSIIKSIGDYFIYLKEAYGSNLNFSRSTNQTLASMYG